MDRVNMPLDHLFETTIIAKLSLIIFISTLVNWLSPPFVIIIVLLSVLFLDLENILQPVVLLFIKRATLSMWHNYNVSLIVWTRNRERRNISFKTLSVVNFYQHKNLPPGMIWRLIWASVWFPFSKPFNVCSRSYFRKMLYLIADPKIGNCRQAIKEWERSRGRSWVNSALKGLEGRA